MYWPAGRGLRWGQAFPFHAHLVPARDGFRVGQRASAYPTRRRWLTAALSEAPGGHRDFHRRAIPPRCRSLLGAVLAALAAPFPFGRDGSVYDRRTVTARVVFSAVGEQADVAKLDAVVIDVVGERAADGGAPIGES